MLLNHVSIVTETYPPEVNGVAHTLGHLVNELHKSGVSVQIVRPAHRKEKPLSAQYGLSHFTTKGLPIPGYPELKFGLPAKHRLLTCWRKQRPDAIYIATEGPLGWSALSASNTLDIPVISGFHTNFHAYSRYYNLGWLEKAILAYLRFFHNRTQATLVPTSEQQHTLHAQNFQNIHIMRRGVDKHLFNPNRRCDALRQQLGAPDDNTSICLYVGRIANEKNIGLVGDAFSCLKKSTPAVRFVMVGDGPQRGKLQEQYPQLQCVGVKQGEELARYYASSDIFLFPSLTDTFGNVVLEAMASGLAIVSFNLAAARELLKHGESGMLADKDSNKAFIQNIEYLLHNLKQRKRIAAAGYRVSDKLSWTSITGEFTQHLERAAGQLEEPTHAKQSFKHFS